MAENPTFQIPKDVIEPIIKAHVATAVAAALGGHGRLVEEAVTRCLMEKVDSQGRPTTGSYDSEEWVVRAMKTAIQTAAKDALMAELPKHRDAIQAMIERSLKQRNSPLLRQLVDAMVNGVAQSDALKYRLNITFDDGKSR